MKSMRISFYFFFSRKKKNGEFIAWRTMNNVCPKEMWFRHEKDVVTSWKNFLSKFMHPFLPMEKKDSKKATENAITKYAEMNWTRTKITCKRNIYLHPENKLRPKIKWINSRQLILSLHFKCTNEKNNIENNICCCVLESNEYSLLTSETLLIASKSNMNAAIL